MQIIKSPGKEEYTFFSARVPAAIWRRAQQYKLDTKTTLQEILTKALDAYLPKKGKRNV